MIGRTLSHYRITGLLGKGGMGEVYRADDTKLGRAVALKVLPAEMSADPERLSRFVREARTVAGLNHPNIVTLHSVDEADGTHFLTMELVDGEPLTAFLTPNGLPLDRILALAIPIVEAVAAAHAQGVVHRDLKPGNVMVSADGKRVKVLDFGLAKAIAMADGTDTDHVNTLTMTAAGTTLGTPFYMSPEQMRGEEVDHRSDIFSLGVMLHELATGERPFQGNSTAELFSAVLRDAPPPVRTLRPDLPEQLQRTILRCLAKAPADRHATAQGLVDDLVALRGGTSAVVRPDDTVAVADPGSTPSHGAHAAGSGAPARGRRSYRLLVASIVLLAAAAILLQWLRIGRNEDLPGESDRRVLAVLPFENLGSEKDDYFAVGITDEIRSRLALIGQLGVISRTSMRAYENTRKTIREIGRELGTDYVLEGTIQWDNSSEPGRVLITPRLVRVSDDTQLWSDSYEREATEIFALQAEIASRIADALDLTLAQAERRALGTRPTESIAAYQAFLQGMRQLNAPGFGRESFELGVQMFERAVAIDPGFALAEARLSSMNSRIYHYGFDRSEARLARAKAAADRALSLQPELPEAHLALGHYFYWGVRDYGRALAALEAARELAPGNSEILLTQAYVKRRQGDFEAAIDLFERERVLNPRDPNSVVGLGETYATLRRYAEAENAFLRGIDLAPDDPYPYTELALVYLRWRGDTAAARASLRKMPQVDNDEACRVAFLVELFDRRYGAALARLAACSTDVLEAGAFFIPTDVFVGMTRLVMEQPDAAREAFAAARSLLADRLGQAPDDPRIHASLGVALAGLGENAEAVRHGRRAVALYPVARDALEAPVQVINLALILAMTGAHAEALEQLDAALSIPSLLSVAWLEADPRWDVIRDEPGFATLLAEHRARRP